MDKDRIKQDTAVANRSFVRARVVGDADLAAQCTQWLDETANARLHGTTREVPCERFARDERAVLQPLAERPYHSLVLTPERECRSDRERRSTVLPEVMVERRALRHYAALTEEVA